MSVSIRIDASETLKRLNSIVERQQFPFALAQAITKTGLDFQTAERSRMQSVFTLRRPDFILRQGVKRIGPAATKANPSITFGIDPRADFLAKFESGTLKQATRGNFLALPTDARRNKRDIITKANRPRALLDRLGRRPGAGGVFKLDAQRGKLAPGIYQRTGRGGRSVKELFAFERTSQTPRLLSFVATFEEVIRERWASNVRIALDEAVRTAR